MLYVFTNNQCDRQQEPPGTPDKLQGSFSHPFGCSTQAVTISWLTHFGIAAIQCRLCIYLSMPVHLATEVGLRSRFVWGALFLSRSDSGWGKSLEWSPISSTPLPPWPDHTHAGGGLSYNPSRERTDGAPRDVTAMRHTHIYNLTVLAH